MIAEPFILAHTFANRFHSSRMKLTIAKAEDAYANKAPNTIGYCKNLLECICKEILTEKGKNFEPKISLEKLP
jgi:hypothetical protein